MWNNIIIFTSIFIVKNILLDIFFDYSQISLFAFELASLAIFNKEFIWTNFIKWIFVGFLGFNSEFKLLTYLDNNTTQFDRFLFFITWLLTFILLQIYYFIKFAIRPKVEELSLHMKKSNLKFLINNFLPLYLWNLSELINPHTFTPINTLNFVNKFMHLIFASFMCFIVPSIIFYIVYEQHYYHNRKKYSFLINQFHPANKGYYITLLFFKIVLGLFISFYYYFEDGNNYSLIILNFLHLCYHIIINKYYKYIYIRYHNNRLSILFLTISLLITIISQIGISIINTTGKLTVQIIELIMFTIMIILSIYINIKDKIRKKKPVRNNNCNDIELPDIP